MSDPGDQGPTVLFNGSPLEGSVELPSGITKIPAHGFQYNCSGITHLTLNADLEEIADGAFSQLSILETIQLNEPNTYFKVIDNVLYNNDISKILCFPQLRAGEYAMPSTITTMVARQFYNCSKMTKITLSENLTLIPEYSFVGCSMLDTAIIPSSVVTISNNAFYGCSELATLTLNSGLKYINESAFENCSKLATLTIPATVETIGNRAFFGCSELATLTLNSGLKYINESAFENCSKLAALSIPATVETIDNRAFYGCSELASLTLAEGLKTIKYNAFDGCKKLTGCTSLLKLIIEDGDEPLTIGRGMNGFDIYQENTWTWIYPQFYQLPLQEVYWGRNITCEYPPFARSGITKISIGPKVTSFGEYSFYDLHSLATVDILGGLEQWCHFDFTENYSAPFSVGSPTILFNGSALYGNVDIPASVTSIPSHAFQFNCAGVTSINFHADVRTIADGAFRGLQIMQNIYLDPANPYLECIENVLYNEGITKIYLYPQLKPGDFEVPATVTELGDYLFSNCTKLTGITIPASVTRLGTELFNNCTALKAVTIEDCDNELNNNASLHELPVETLYVGRNISTTFYNNSYYSENLRYVTISNHVTAFPYNFFFNCNNIQSVNFNGDITEWCRISFANETATPFGSSNVSPILYLNGNPLHSQVNIPSGATKIGAYAFYGQKGVSRINVPSTVTTIEQNAFNSPFISDVIIAANGVTTLEAISAINDNTCIYVPKIWLDAYRVAPNWSHFADRIFPDGFLQVTVDLIAMSNSPALLPALNALEEVDGEYRITALTNLKIRGTMNGFDILMIRTKMPNLRKLDLSEATIVNNDNGYEYYTGYHTDLETITPYMFYNIKNLKEIILPANIKTIQSNAFAKSGITSMVIPSTVKTIGEGAFSECQDLVNLTLTKGLETIGYNAFWQCTKLRALVLPTTLRRIEGSAFADCSGLTTIDFAEGLQYIGSWAFAYCYNLKELRMPTSLRQIDEYAFKSCSGLSEVHVPSMITQIGDYAFKNCGLKSVYAYTLTPVQINQDTFDYTGTELFAPKTSFYTYYINTQWAQFPILKEFDAKYLKWYTPRDYDIQINTTNPIPNEDDENRAEGNMEPGSGLIFIGDGQQLVKDLILNWQHGANYPALIEDGNLDVEELKFIMNVYPGRWYFFSFPFDIKISDTSFDGKYVWRYYDAEERAENGSGGWKNVTDGWLRANVGYIFQANKEGDLELPVNNPQFAQSTGQKEVPLESHPATNAQDASWNFVGNPNLSYYDLDDVENSGFTAPITVWDEEQQTYTAVVPGDDEYDFHPFQAYFVQTPENTDNLTFDDENRSTYVQTEQKAGNRSRAHAARRVNEKRLLVNLILSNGSTTDKTRVIFNDDNRMDYEAGRDANKFMSMANVPQLYSLDAKGVKYAVNARPNGNREVRLGFVATADGTYTIEADRMDCSMALKDNLTGQIHVFDKGDYEFYSEAGTFDNRFTLISGLDVTAITGNKIEGIDISTFDGGIVINGATEGEVKIYNVNGVKSTSISGTGSAMLTPGTYIVSYNGKSTKVVVK